MKTQIAVRLEEETVQYIDRQVAAGSASSRADLIGRLVAREARRQQALDDIEKMKRAGVTGYPDLSDLPEATARRQLDLD